MHFHKVKMNLVLTDSELQPFDECYISNYILLLPELDKEGYINIQGNGSYYVIDSEWNELGCDMKLISPKSNLGKERPTKYAFINTLIASDHPSIESPTR